MNPFPVVFSLLNRNRVTLIFFVVLITFAVGLGIAITTQERAVRQGSARAADKFDLVIGSPGSPFDLVLASVYARPAAMGLVGGDMLAQIMAEDSIDFAAPIAFGDSASGYPIMGTTAQFVEHLSGGVAEGRLFTSAHEAVLGANVRLELGARLHSAHDGFDSEEMLQIFGEDVSDLVATIDHNLTESQPGRAPLFQRTLTYDNIPADVIERWQQFAAEKSQRLLEELDQWLAPYDQDVSQHPSNSNTDRVRTGVGVFYFEDPIQTRSAADSILSEDHHQPEPLAGDPNESGIH